LKVAKRQTSLFVGFFTSRKMTFHGRILPRLIGNRTKKKCGNIFEIKFNDTIAVAARTGGKTYKIKKRKEKRDTTAVVLRTAIIDINFKFKF